MSELPIYLDHHSTTPCDARVVEAMLPYFFDNFGNAAASTHVHGRRAASALEDARASVAQSLGCLPSEIHFTSGATESNNIALRGIALDPGAHVVTSAVEHSSIFQPLEQMARLGIEHTAVMPDARGVVHAAAIRDAIRPSTVLVSVMAANAEFGTIEPIAEIGDACRASGVPLHTDATQAVGKIPFDLGSLPVDIASLSAHKFYGPKGIGAIFLRTGTSLLSPVAGGGQEKKVRSGTVNVAGAVGLAKALSIAVSGMADESVRLVALRTRLRTKLLAVIPDAVVNGPDDARLPGNLHVSLPGVDVEALLHAMRRFSLSTGAACASGRKEPSRALKAIGLDERIAMSSLRFGLGRCNTEAHVDLLVEDLAAAVSRLRQISV
ncbi:MAG: cysteine desulfurase family protein [Thermoanaerobaculia bacterium]|jgi:cysteine desulfurase